MPISFSSTEGSQTISANATRRISRSLYTAAFSEGLLGISPSGGAARQRCGGAMCPRPCVAACRAAKPHPAGPDSRDCFSGYDSPATFANRHPALAGRDGLMPMSVFYGWIGRSRTAPERPRSVFSTTIWQGSSVVGRCAGMLSGQMTCVVMPHHDAAPSLPKASMTRSRFCDSFYASCFCEASARRRWHWRCRRSRISVTRGFPRFLMKPRGVSSWRPLTAGHAKVGATTPWRSV